MGQLVKHGGILSLWRVVLVNDDSRPLKISSGILAKRKELDGQSVITYSLYEADELDRQDLFNNLSVGHIRIRRYFFRLGNVENWPRYEY